MTFRWATASHQGLVRSANEDAVHPTDSGQDEGPIVLAVADGMGGHAAGDVASRVALEAAVGLENGAGERVEAANQAVVEAARQRSELAGMGTTLTLVRLEKDGRASIGHVGDSRAYLLRDGSLRQLTTDHSLMAEYLATGKIEPEEVPTHPLRSVVTRALGMSTEVDVDVVEEQLGPGDRLLLCSDGLTGMIPDDEIGEILGSRTDPDDAAWALVEAANRAGGEDNISVIVVDVVP